MAVKSESICWEMEHSRSNGEQSREVLGITEEEKGLGGLELQ